MFYRPKFCCNCGEKVERADWRLWTSRRFCDVCEVEYKGTDLLPRVFVGLACLFGAIGIGSYVLVGTSPVGTGSKLQRSFDPSGSTAIGSRPLISTPADPRFRLENDRAAEAIGSLSSGAGRETASRMQPELPNRASDEPAYFCGAMTKKGKPCSRRVKAAGERCWQHKRQSLARSTHKAPDFF